MAGSYTVNQLSGAGFTEFAGIRQKSYHSVVKMTYIIYISLINLQSTIKHSIKLHDYKNALYCGLATILKYNKNHIVSRKR